MELIDQVGVRREHSLTPEIQRNVDDVVGFLPLVWTIAPRPCSSYSLGKLRDSWAVDPRGEACIPRSAVGRPEGHKR